jgi:hypothetical protein
METLCGCREEGVQTKDYYKLKRTTKAYKLSYNRIQSYKSVGLGNWYLSSVRDSIQTGFGVHPTVCCLALVCVLYGSA